MGFKSRNVISLSCGNGNGFGGIFMGLSASSPMFHMGTLWVFKKKHLRFFCKETGSDCSRMTPIDSCTSHAGTSPAVQVEKNANQYSRGSFAYVTKWIECDIDAGLEEKHVSDIWLYIYSYAWLIMFGSVPKVPFHGPFRIPHQPSTRSSWTSTWIPKNPDRGKTIHQLSRHHDPEDGQWIFNRNYITKYIDVFPIMET